MTVTYTSEVTTCRGVSCFLKLLARWRGSIYKIVWVDLLMFLGFYYILNLTYRFLLDESSRSTFEKVVRYCEKYSSLIPLSFVLGFYVSLVMTRWWNQYTSIPFPDNLAILVGASIKGQNDRARIVRRTIVRYFCVAFTITLSMVSPKVKKRFPTLNHYIEAGLLNADEKKIMEDMDNEFPSYSKYWLPLAWASNIVTRARHEGLIRDDESVTILLEELNLIRSRCGSMLDYDWISVPLVYTQVVTLAVYSYFITGAIGQQQIFPQNSDEIDVYFPFLPVLEFFFYMGWLKVAETLINPYGEDDDDFEVVWMIDRHVQVSYLLVDKIHQEHPKLTKDMYWDQMAPNSLPYTIASQDYMQEYPFPSTTNLQVKKADQNVIKEDNVMENQTDGDVRHASAGKYLWRLYGQKPLPLRKRRTTSKEMPLQNVIHMSDDRHNAQDIEEINAYDESIQVAFHNTGDTTDQAYCEDFERLRRQRKDQHKRKLLRYLEFLKKDKVEDLENIIDDLVQ